MSREPAKALVTSNKGLKSLGCKQYILNWMVTFSCKTWDLSEVQLNFQATRVRENESPKLFLGVADPSQIQCQVQVTLSYPWFPLKRGGFSIKNMTVRPLVGWNIWLFKLLQTARSLHSQSLHHIGTAGHIESPFIGNMSNLCPQKMKDIKTLQYDLVSFSTSHVKVSS
jgi:hypothetical protein